MVAALFPGCGLDKDAPMEEKAPLLSPLYRRVSWEVAKGKKDKMWGEREGRGGSPGEEKGGRALGDL